MTQENSSKKGPGAGQRFYGKYRGTVFNNLDPECRGRIMAMVPKVYGELPSYWALPCMPGVGLQPPVGGPAAGMFSVPAMGTWVWIEFEEGDPERPIWSGGFWPMELLDAQTEAPITATTTMLQTQAYAALILDDIQGIILRLLAGQCVRVTPAGVLIQASPAVSVLVSEAGIQLQAGSSTLAVTSAGITMTSTGPISVTGTVVTMNDGALLVK